MDIIFPMNAEQCRMARAALKLSVRDLAAAARVGANTVVRLEAGEKLQERTVEAIRTALEKAGVEFIAENGGGAGVRLKKPAKGVEEITQEIDALEDKISSILAPTQPGPEAAMNTMRKAVAESDLTKLKARKRIRSDPSK